MPRLARNTFFNLLGFGLPLLLAVLAVPALTERAGDARFGFVAIAWALIGYAGVLDLGLSRVFARRIAAARIESRHALSREAGALARATRLSVLGCTAIAVLLAFAVPVHWWAEEVPAQELRLGWLALLLALPAIIATSLQRGAMEGLEAFGAVNVLRVGLGVWMFAGPLLVLLVTPSLPWLVLSLSIGRWVSFALHRAWCRRLLPAPLPGPVDLGLRASLREGLWITVSNVVSPLMVVFDRIALAALAGLASVSAYAIAQEISLRLLLVPGALSLALFPRLAALAAPESGPVAASLSNDAFRWATAVMLVLCAAGVLASGPALAVWLAPPLASQTEVLLSVMLLGVVANAGAQVAFTLLQATGHARAPALLHLAELPIYAAALAWAVPRYGLLAAAWLWTLRVLVDAAAMIWLARSVFPWSIDRLAVAGWLAAIATLAGLVFADGFRAVMLLPIVAVVGLLLGRELKRTFFR